MHLKEVNRLVTEHTIAYRAQGAIAGEYTTEDMAAGDTMFGDHETLIARVPKLIKTAINRMKSEMAQKRKNTLPTMFF